MNTLLYILPSVVATCKGVYFIKQNNDDAAIQCSIMAIVMLALSLIMSNYRFLLYIPLVSVVF